LHVYAGYHGIVTGGTRNNHDENTLKLCNSPGLRNELTYAECFLCVTAHLRHCSHSVLLEISKQAILNRLHENRRISQNATLILRFFQTAKSAQNSPAICIRPRSTNENTRKINVPAAEESYLDHQSEGQSCNEWGATFQHIWAIGLLPWPAKAWTVSCQFFWQSSENKNKRNILLSWTKPSQWLMYYAMLVKNSCLKTAKDHLTDGCRSSWLVWSQTARFECFISTMRNGFYTHLCETQSDVATNVSFSKHVVTKVYNVQP